MGWWMVKNENSIEIGDGVLDKGRHFLKSIADAYTSELGRNPTLEELEYILTLSFATNANSDVLENFDELRVQKVLIKTAKRLRRVKPQIGDVFAFKLNDQQYGFGRLVHKLALGTIVEIFNYISTHPTFDHSKEQDWLISPVLINAFGLLDQKTEGDWQIVDSNKNYKPDHRFENIYFGWKDSDSQLILEGVFDKKIKKNEDELKKYPRYVTVSDKELRQLVTDALK